jgi:hypothetical protein
MFVGARRRHFTQRKIQHRRTPKRRLRLGPPLHGGGPSQSGAALLWPLYRLNAQNV